MLLPPPVRKWASAPVKFGENNNSEKVETGNYADSAVFVGILGAVIASIVCVLYLKKKNQDSDA